MKTTTLVGAIAITLALVGCGAAPGPTRAGIAAPIIAVPSDKVPSPEEVVEAMGKALESTPVLHVTVLDRHYGVDYRCDGWMMGPKAMGEVRRDGKLVCARYTDRHRIQEYVPKAKFVNGTEADGVLLEYDADPNGPSGDWLRLMDVDFTCGPGIIGADAYLRVQHATLPEAYHGNMMGSEVTEEVLNGRACYRYHLKSTVEADTLTWDLYVDRSSFELVRQSRLIESEGKVKKDDVYDFTFEHLANDDGIHWGLDPAKLRK